MVEKYTQMTTWWGQKGEEIISLISQVREWVKGQKPVLRKTTQ